MTTLEQALYTVSQLPPDRQEMLIEIIQNRLVETRRQEIAKDAKESIAAFHQGKLKSQSLEMFAQVN
ncbi:hypothetical protein IQ238_14875 [Pleurocapsales cyanobacterium LEGE 06147]|nr:hypothetical protein [Pleurocapsales cyanobacterium LEGE 06147]